MTCYISKDSSVLKRSFENSYTQILPFISSMPQTNIYITSTFYVLDIKARYPHHKSGHQGKTCQEFIKLFLILGDSIENNITSGSLSAYWNGSLSTRGSVILKDFSA